MPLSRIAVFSASALFTLLSLACERTALSETSMNPKTTTQPATAPTTPWTNKTEAELRELLTPEQFKIARQSGTERAFSGQYWNEHAKGVYHCAICNTVLFNSDTKFDSGTGWPSFWKPANDKSVIAETDSTHGMKRTEVKCATCGSHLGHVFDDGPEPTGLRYCMNSAVLKLEKEEGNKPAAKK